MTQTSTCKAKTQICPKQIFNLMYLFPPPTVTKQTMTECKKWRNGVSQQVVWLRSHQGRATHRVIKFINIHKW